MIIHNYNEPFIMDYGNAPLIINIDRYSTANKSFRAALWTGVYMQVTLMSIPVGESIGIERHGDLDQFIRIEGGTALVEMGLDKSNLSYKRGQQRLCSNSSCGNLP